MSVFFSVTRLFHVGSILTNKIKMIVLSNKVVTQFIHLLWCSFICILCKFCHILVNN